MRTFRFVISLLVVFTLLVGSNNVAFAQATRTWVSGVGDDANPCSRTAPCKTFAGAISKTAAGGEINVLDPGGYGAVTITKAMTIDGGGNIAGVLVSGTNGIIVNAGPNDVVVLRNLNINGLGTGLSGIKFLAGGGLNVEHNKIFGFTVAAIEFTPSATSTLQVNDTMIVRNSGGGILVKPTATGLAKVTVNRVTMFLNNYGVRAEDRSTVAIRDSVASSNVNNGYLAFSASAPTVLNIANSLAMDNVGTATSAGIKSAGAGAIVRITGNFIFNNSVGLATATGGSLLSFGDNRNTGNVTNGAPTGLIGLQ
jgi:hypothetical protein